MTTLTSEQSPLTHKQDLHHKRPSVHGWVLSSDEWVFIHASAKKAFVFIYLCFYLCPYRKALSVINIIINNGQHSTTT
jgi:hypothetical protein